MAELVLYGKRLLPWQHLGTVLDTEVENSVIRLSSAGQSRAEAPAVMINCHYDSVPQAPGASDDAVSCAVMLETIRVLASSNRTVLTNDLIFLFNGAEESVLVASHGFITSHPWAKAGSQ